MRKKHNIIKIITITTITVFAGFLLSHKEARAEEDFYACIGAQLADYMNAICNAKANGEIPENVKLLSPAFNMTSRMFDGIVNGMNTAGANWECLDGIAGNIYNRNGSIRSHWENQNIDRFSKPIYITETGAWGNSDAEIQALKPDIDFLKSKTIASLLFAPFGSNPSFSRHNLSDEQIRFLCGGACGKIGANFGTAFKSGRYNKAREHGMQWALEIANNGNLDATASAINDEGMNIIVRIGTTDGSGGFDDVNTYINFLSQLASRVNGKIFYAIAGPNEPGDETWIAPQCENPEQPEGPLSACLSPMGYQAISTPTEQMHWRIKGNISFSAGDIPSNPISQSLGDIISLVPKTKMHEYTDHSDKAYHIGGSIENFASSLEEMRPPTWKRIILPKGSFPGVLNRPQDETDCMPGEDPNDCLKRMFPSKNAEEVGQKATGIIPAALACIQKAGKDSGGKLFWMTGESGRAIEFEIPEYENEEYIAGSFVHQALTGTPGTFNPYLAYKTDSEINQNTQASNTQDTPLNTDLAQQNDKDLKNPNSTQPANVSSLYNPTAAGAQDSCVPNEGCANTSGMEQKFSLIPFGPQENSRVIFRWQGCRSGGCWLSDYKFRIWANSDNQVHDTGLLSGYTLPVCGEGGPAKMESGWADGRAPAWDNINLSPGNSFTATIHLYHGTSKGGDGCPQSLPPISCTLTNPDGKIKSTCVIDFLPAKPEDVNCNNCTTWNPWCNYKVSGMQLKSTDTCVEGKCKVEFETQETSSGCIGNWYKLGDIWRCLFSPKYDIYVQPLPYIDKYYLDKDLNYQPALALVPGATDSLFDNEPCVENITFTLKFKNNKLHIIDDYEETKDFTPIAYPYSCKPRLSGFCALMASLSIPGEFPDKYNQLCQPFGFGGDSEHIHVGPDVPPDQQSGGTGGYTGSLVDGNYTDPGTGAVVAMYNCSGSARDDPNGLVDTLHCNWMWDQLQNSPDNINLSSIKQWVDANNAAGKKSIIQLDWIESSNASNYNAGVPNFVLTDDYDPVIYNSTRLPNYANSKVKSSAEKLIRELGRQFNNYQGIEAVQIMNERRPSHTTTTPGYDQKWGNAYGQEWVDWNKFLVDKYKLAFPNTRLIANITGGKVEARAPIVEYLIRNGIGIKTSGLIPDLKPRQISLNSNSYNPNLNTIDALRNNMAMVLTAGEHGNTSQGKVLPSWTEQYEQHPPQVFYWDVRALLSFGGDQIHELYPSMINPDSQLVRESINFFKKYRNTDATNTSSAWIYLRGSEWPQDVGYLYDENYGWFIIQDSTPADGKTEKWFGNWVNPQEYEDADKSYIYNRYYRSTTNGGKMYFKLHPQFAARSSNFKVKVRFKAIGDDDFEVKYSSGGIEQTAVIEGTTNTVVAKAGDNNWYEETFVLEGLTPGELENENDFYIDSNGIGEEYIGFVEVIPL